MSHREQDQDNNEICVFTARQGTQESESFKNACFLSLSEDQRDISIMSVTPEVQIYSGDLHSGGKDTLHLTRMFFFLLKGI